MTDGLSEAYEQKKWDVFCENNELKMEVDELKSENGNGRNDVRTHQIRLRPATR